MIHKTCALARGIKLFKCVRCGKKSSNYANGVSICKECCEKKHLCEICGKEIKDEGEE